ncbi:MAG: hypothetical protein ACRDRH_06865 [Pseudonocardia sp.]
MIQNFKVDQTRTFSSVLLLGVEPKTAFGDPYRRETAKDPHITAGDAGYLTEGPRWEVVVSPGVFRVRTRDYARAERRPDSGLTTSLAERPPSV